MRIHVLASSSSGNSVLVEAGGTAVLVDCGLSGAEAVRRIKAVGSSPERISAILVSHEHTDHIQGVGVLARRFGLPVHGAAGTLAACNGHLSASVEQVAFEPGEQFEIGGLTIRPFPIPHDAADPVGFTFRHGGVKAGLATDLGFCTALATQHLAACNLLILESNHDPEMLARSSYPWEVKRRIRSRQGHLSNEEAGQLLERVLHDGLEEVVLAHLSEKNNRPELAASAARRVLERRRLSGRVRLSVADARTALSLAAGEDGGGAEYREADPKPAAVSPLPGG